MEGWLKGVNEDEGGRSGGQKWRGWRGLKDGSVVMTVVLIVVLSAVVLVRLAGSGVSTPISVGMGRAHKVDGVGWGGVGWGGGETNDSDRRQRRVQ